MAILLIIKIVIVVLLIAVTSALIYTLIKSRKFRYDIRVSDALNFSKSVVVNINELEKIEEKRVAIERKFANILQIVKSDNERDLRLAVIEADNLIDEVLIVHGHPGKDMGERLRSVNPQEIKNLNELWEAHKIRNRIAHESGFHITPAEARKVVSVFKNVLDDLLSKELMHKHVYKQ